MSLQITEKTASMLEWPEFLDLYSQFIASAAAREQIATVGPVEKFIEEWELSREALQCAAKDQIPGFSSLENISGLLQRAAVENQILEGFELYSVYRLSALNNDLRSRIHGWKADYPRLFEKYARLPDLGSLEEEIQSMLEPSGEVKEDATAELKQIRKQTAVLKSKVEHVLERYFRDARYKNALQEEYLTYRHGRAVLLVRAEQKGSIRGVIHGESGSGASLYLEPLNVLELNNELAQLADRRTQETLRILKMLTARTGKDSSALLFSLQQMIRLDLIFARGRFGKAFHCVIPEIANDFRIRLLEARHPLLEAALQKQRQPVVPFTFELGHQKKVLIVTGPNTGGKTVFLKTVGLLSLMAHSAIPIPAAEGSLLPEFSSIDADIGDLQSISESLSTFSSHINNIVGILSKIRERALILLDELGTGTDPEEGAPLAVSIVQELLAHNIKAIVTSHHSRMKVFAFQHPEGVTAAMEFDPDHLRPTYRVLMEQMGASHALDMAKRLNMPEPILERARKITGEQQLQLQEFQALLQRRAQELETKLLDLEEQRKIWEARAQDQQKQLDQAKKKLEHELSKLRDQNADLLRTLNARVQNLISQVKIAQERSQLRKEFQEQIVPIMEQLQETTEVSQAPLPEFQGGDRVWVSLYKDFGQIVSLKKDQAEVIIRNKRFLVPLTLLEKKGSVVEALPPGIRMNVSEKQVDPELNLIGQTIEEALSAADKYLDDAFVGQLPEVRLIHGHGTGRLKKAIEEMLSSHPHVRSFHSESPQRGGTGVTVVELKTLNQ